MARRPLGEARKPPGGESDVSMTLGAAFALAMVAGWAVGAEAPWELRLIVAALAAVLVAVEVLAVRVEPKPAR
jgi:hypothetical protein